jgi:hypothetical protein
LAGWYPWWWNSKVTRAGRNNISNSKLCRELKVFHFPALFLIVLTCKRTKRQFEVPCVSIPPYSSLQGSS